ncbi:unnamed protein product [Pseudo-nitzschia multistriata]|uniref:Uncharacterized protein n=1 Tax=Pseudo-nitzschia multistriata TaxID=183589 RepID=A0A448YZD0_9STRA|nr:unnamed protein product [Pseudo-nitzschia multistriata]
MTDSAMRASASLMSWRSPISMSPPNMTNRDPSELWEFSMRASSKVMSSISDSCFAPHARRRCELRLDAFLNFPRLSNVDRATKPILW